eukprot:jgi/Botrbrau1/12059/Bobra.0295s0014.1
MSDIGCDSQALCPLVHRQGHSPTIQESNTSSIVLPWDWQLHRGHILVPNLPRSAVSRLNGGRNLFLKSTRPPWSYPLEKAGPPVPSMIRRLPAERRQM